MDARDKIIFALADRACGRISRAAIAALQKMTDGMQSGDDSGLKNVWDEICVQVQGKESALWEAYLHTIRTVVSQSLMAADREARQAIWLQTSNGLDWEADEGAEITDMPVDDDDLIDHILREYIMSAAADWTNPRIGKYKDRSLEID